MSNEKRIPRSYKSTDSDYMAAMKRAKKEKAKLAVIIEEVVIAYANGAATVHFIKNKEMKK